MDKQEKEKIESTSNEKSIDEFLEEDMKKLAEEIKAIKIKAEKNHLDEMEVIKKSLAAFTPIPQTTSQAQSQTQDLTNPLPQYTNSFPPETKLEIEYLLDLAFHKGIGKALEEALKSKNPAIIDTFHDALVGKIYPELKKRNLI
jgi:hypothetical protein